jgi:class 3 adenylate cyclase
MQRALTLQEWPLGERLRVRMGIHTGEVTEASTGLVGYEVHRAARIAAVGHGGQVLLSSAAAGLIEDSLPGEMSLRNLGTHRLKDTPSRTPPCRGRESLESRRQPLVGRSTLAGNLPLAVFGPLGLDCRLHLRRRFLMA